MAEVSPKESEAEAVFAGNEDSEYGQDPNPEPGVGLSVYTSWLRCRHHFVSCLYVISKDKPMPQIIRSFSGRYAALGPMYQSGFLFEGGQYQSAVAAFEAAKIVNHADRVSFLAWNCKPWEARRKGKMIPASWIRPDFDSAQCDVMLSIQRAKFSWPDPQRILISTVGLQLIFGNLVHDNFWGACSCHGVPDSKRKFGRGRHCNGTGQNLLGNILMQIRQEMLNVPLAIAS